MNGLVLGIMILGILIMLVGSIAVGSSTFDSVLGMDFGDLDGWKTIYTFGFVTVVAVLFVMIGVADNL